MQTTGRHLLVEYMGCAFEVLNDPQAIEAAMREAAIAAQTTILHTYFHPFTPQGVSGVVVVEESHLSIHTWPELGYASVDFYTCGKGHPREAHRTLQRLFQATSFEIMQVRRGLNPLGEPNKRCMRVERAQARLIQQDDTVGSALHT